MNNRNKVLLLASILLVTFTLVYIKHLQAGKAAAESRAGRYEVICDIQQETISDLEQEVQKLDSIFTQWGQDRETISKTRAVVRSAVKDALAESELFQGWANTALPPDLLPGGRLRNYPNAGPGNSNQTDPAPSLNPGNPAPGVGRHN